MMDKFDRLFMQRVESDPVLFDKGLITKLFNCECLTCDTKTVQRVDDLRTMKSYLNRRGWKRTYEGWICPVCNRQTQADS